MTTPAGGIRSWVPGAVLLVAAAIADGLAGLALGIRTLPPYLGLAAAVLLGMGWIERLCTAPQAPFAPKGGAKLKVIRGGKPECDLAADEATNNQRYLM